ncbi:TetR/AcrR family transcriptional regulator [Rufibacter psychrotolerans]|uniref:TetR/AcrR family transcriptional regulator n=1 Tax=Rufibacter psychrotolerans TaxID=2812556 RepID=UPI0019674314|nr:TetR/AcrR family transcriptional regulator [Rufibacter sp. SYSU D00308]
MKDHFLQKGRTNQKLRTRQALLAAAREILQTNGAFSLDEVAKRALVSRATVYRYFSDAETLQMEASLDIKTKSPEELLQGLDQAPATQRVLCIQQHLFDIARQNESAFRAYLGAVLKLSATQQEQGSKLRGSRRIPMLETALAPFRSSLTQEEYARLVHVLAVLSGIEAYISLKDVSKLSYKEATQTIQWGICTLVQAVLAKAE